MNTYLGIELKHEADLIEWPDSDGQVPTKTKDLANYLRECISAKFVAAIDTPRYIHMFSSDHLFVSLNQDTSQLNIVIGIKGSIRTLLCIQIQRGLEGQPDTMNIINDADFGTPTADQINQIRLILTFMGDISDYRPWYEALTAKAEQNKVDA